LTLQPQGSGDFFDPNNLPTSSHAVSVECRVISTGPTYVDVALSGGSFEAAFGPAPNNVGPSGRGDSRLRLRADRFFSNVPYTRMVGALTQLTAVPDRSKEPSADGLQTNEVDSQSTSPHGNICMDDVLKEAIISTHSFTDPQSPLFHDVDACDLQQLVSLLNHSCVHDSRNGISDSLSFFDRAARLPNLPCQLPSNLPIKHLPTFRRIHTRSSIL
jgi:hypothetical protein